jgi:hypothetical protein
MQVRMIPGGCVPPPGTAPGATAPASRPYTYSVWAGCSGDEIPTATHPFGHNSRKVPSSCATEWDEDEIGNGEARPFPGPNGDVMEIVVGLIPTAYRLIFELLAWTGLPRSEVLGLKGKDST